MAQLTMFEPFPMKQQFILNCLLTVSQSRLDVKEMLGVYLVLSAGIIISIVVVAVEIWWQRSLGKKMKSFVADKKR